MIAFSVCHLLNVVFSSFRELDHPPVHPPRLCPKVRFTNIHSMPGPPTLLKVNSGESFKLFKAQLMINLPLIDQEDKDTQTTNPHEFIRVYCKGEVSSISK